MSSMSLHHLMSTHEAPLNSSPAQNPIKKGYVHDIVWGFALGSCVAVLSLLLLGTAAAAATAATSW